MSIPTFDAVGAVHKRIAGELAKYPANSVSKREIIATVPLGSDPEAQFARLDAKLTKVIYDDAVAAYKRNEGKPYKVVPSQELERLSAVVQKAAEALTPKAPQAPRPR